MRLTKSFRRPSGGFCLHIERRPRQGNTSENQLLMVPSVPVVMNGRRKDSCPGMHFSLTQWQCTAEQTVASLSHVTALASTHNHLVTGLYARPHVRFCRRHYWLPRSALAQFPQAVTSRDDSKYIGNFYVTPSDPIPSVYSWSVFVYLMVLCNRKELRPLKATAALSHGAEINV